MSNPTDLAEQQDIGPLAVELREALGQLIRRLRAENVFPLSQGMVLGRLDRCGRASIGELAAAERVRPQSMTQTIADLEADGLIARSSDPDDGRRTLIELTGAGRRILEQDRARRDGWLARAISEELSARERAQLARAIALMERLATA